MISIIVQYGPQFMSYFQVHCVCVQSTLITFYIAVTFWLKKNVGLVDMILLGYI